MSDSQRDQLQAGASLLEAVRESESELPGVAPFLSTLEAFHTQAVSSLRRRETLVAASQEATRQLSDDLAAVHDASIALRSFIKGVLGLRNARLDRFGIKPLRKRGRPPVRTDAPGPVG